MGCDALLKGTSVDGVYTADPKKEPGAERYEQLSYLEVLAQDLRVMDASAISLMRDNAHPDRGVLDPRARQPAATCLQGEGVFTTIADERRDQD